ncbi:MAG: alpha/beta fold hydrolase [Pseudomonadota bacterium]
MSEPVRLVAQSFGESGEPLVVLHGLLGSGTNWRTVARRLSEAYTVWLPDARNHGRSPHVPNMGYAEQADDVLALLDRERIERAHIMGHSMGGKTAMTMANRAPNRVRSLTVVDIAPVSYPSDPESPQRRLMTAMQQLDLTRITSRKDADRTLAEAIDDHALRAFALLGLDRIDDAFQWRMNVDELLRSLPTMRDFPSLAKPAYPGPTHFIYGDQSPYVQPEHHRDIEALFPRVQWSSIASAGHWVHAEQPAAFIEAVERFLREIAP